MKLSLATTLAVVTAAGCGGSSPVGPTPVAGATPVRGTEHLAWNQAGDVSRLRFRAYVDDRAVDLPAATCNTGTPEADCSSPLPALSDGVHTIALVNVLMPWGIESERTSSLTVQKVSARSSIAVTLPLASARTGSLRLDSVVSVADGLSFRADIVATNVRAPAQLAWVPDGRLFVAEADGGVRIVRPGAPEAGSLALEPGMLTSGSVGPLGIASHPDFAENHFLYVSLLERERPDRTVVRIVRLREVGDTLGEPATLYVSPVVVSPSANGSREDGTAVLAGTRLAFGPDRLLYLMLPAGTEFVNEPAASTPQASVLRVSDEGRTPSVGPLSGVTSSPLGFTWSPSTGALWMLLRGASGEAVLGPLSAGPRAQVVSAEPAALRFRDGSGPSARTLVLRPGVGNLAAARALLAPPAGYFGGAARLALPALAENQAAGVPDGIGDVVAGAGGTLFVATSNARLGSSASSAATDVIVRLTPLSAQAAR